MSDDDLYKRHPTKPLPRVALAPIASALDAAAETKVECPICDVPLVVERRLELLSAHDFVHADRGIADDLDEIDDDSSPPHDPPVEIVDDSPWIEPRDDDPPPEAA